MPDLVKAATASLKKKPSEKEIEEFLDNHEDLGALCDDFLSRLIEQPATKKKALQVYQSLKGVLKKEEEKEAK